jgi:hypothetical protein
MNGLLERPAERVPFTGRQVCWHREAPDTFSVILAPFLPRCLPAKI